MRGGGEFALGIDVGGTTTKVALVSGTGSVEQVETFPTGTSDPEALVANIAASIRKLSGQRHTTGAGIAAAGFLNSDRDRISYNPNLEWLVNFPLRDQIAGHVTGPVFMEVDSNASCLAEYLYGSGRGSTRFFCLTAGTGLGAGMVIEGQILRFAGECLGDAGHVIVEPNGPPCTCGGRGCAEAVIGAAGIIDRAGRPGSTLEKVIEAARAGDRRCIDALYSTGVYLGVAMASLASIFLPDRFAIAGGLAEAGALVLESAESSYRRSASATMRNSSVLKATLGWQATVVGASTLAIT